jgi:hypothetical protein
MGVSSTTEMGNDMKKLFIAGAVVVVAASVSMGSASAAKPRVQACIGSTSSTNAQTFGGLGERRSGFATNENGFGGPGFGDEMQVLQAGFVSDTQAPNTCND